MERIARILILGWSAEQLEEMEGELCLIPDLQISAQLLTTDVGLSAIVRAQLIQQRPDFLLYVVGSSLEHELKELSLVPGPVRPSTLVLITPAALMELGLIRLAMHAGFRDHMARDEVHTRLADLFRALNKERRATLEVKNRIAAFISPKGGVGCSTLAASVGHVLSSTLGQKTLLLDLDCQFGTQYLFHDLEPSKGLKEALEHIDTLDVMALRGYLQVTATGLEILGVVPSQTLIPGDIDPDRLIRLLDLLTGEYDNLIIDMPNQIDTLYGTIIERINRVVLVVHQDLASVRHSAKLMDLLERELDLPRHVVSLVVNAHDPDKPITVEDIARVLNLEVIGTIPRDEEAVSLANNLGLPLGVHAPGSAAQKVIEKMAHAIVGLEGVEKEDRNLVRRVLRRLRITR